MIVKVIHSHTREYLGDQIKFQPGIAELPDDDATRALVICGFIESPDMRFDGGRFGRGQPQTVEDMRKLIGGVK